MSSAEFIQQRGRKIFQTNYAPGFSPHELLSAAAGAISGIVNPQTGQKIWRIDRPLPLQDKPGAFYVYAVAAYPVANIGGTVGLTLGAIPQDDVGIQFIAYLEDSMSWDIGIAEQIADVALVTIQRGMTARYPEHGGWAMTAGAWRYGHRFAAPAGVPPDPPLPAASQAGEQPVDFFYNPLTARVWGGNFPVFELQSFLNFTASVLAQRNEGWTLEYFMEEVDGAKIPCFSGHRILPAGTVLYVYGFCQYKGNSLMQMLMFADSGYWSAHSMIEAMEQTAAAVNAALQAKFGSALKLLPPPQQP